MHLKKINLTMLQSRALVQLENGIDKIADNDLIMSIKLVRYNKKVPVLFGASGS